MSETLKPCPFCGGSEYTRFCRQDKGHCFDVDYHRSVSVDGIRQMICINCGARGPESTRDREHCREKWNTRADDNRWRTVAEQAERALEPFADLFLNFTGGMPEHALLVVTDKQDREIRVDHEDWQNAVLALAAFDSLRKEEGL